MLQVILYVIPVFIIYLLIRSSWVANETLKTKYRLARLKDELIWLAIEGEVNHANKEYAQLYDAIDRMRQSLHRLNFWVMLYVLLKEKHQLNIHEAVKDHNDINKNSSFKNISEAYYKALITYVARKNFITVLLTIPVWKKALGSRLSASRPRQKNESGNTCIDVNEYSSFVFYLQSISAKSLLAG
jgi:hypothetical protein